MEKIVLLGATGSIGTSTLDIIRRYPDYFQLVGVSGYRNTKRLSEIIEEFSPQYVWSADNSLSKQNLKKKPKFLQTEEELYYLAALEEADTIIIGISGIAGLLPTIRAIESGKKILSANKEAIVCAGGFINQLLQKRPNFIIPLDSEHNAIFNLLKTIQSKDVSSITLTASGGPFRIRDIDQGIKIEDVLNHPTWDMGNYITVNSATMMNKGFEVIEAHYLFKMGYSKIRVLIHPQSTVHGMVTLNDGTVLMSASPSDMRYPIASAMFYPDIPKEALKPLDFFSSPLEFFEVDTQKFPLLKLSYDVGKVGGILPCAMNAANEIAVDAFLSDKLHFMKIPQIVQEVVDRFVSKNQKAEDIQTIMAIDKESRDIALSILSDNF